MRRIWSSSEWGAHAPSVGRSFGDSGALIPDEGRERRRRRPLAWIVLLSLSRNLRDFSPVTNCRPRVQPVRRSTRLRRRAAAVAPSVRRAHRVGFPHSFLATAAEVQLAGGRGECLGKVGRIQPRIHRAGRGPLSTIPNINCCRCRNVFPPSFLPSLSYALLNLKSARR